jgi:peptidoglycan/xylan/chitin deacetylase (PgdA/CDA1 family)
VRPQRRRLLAILSVALLPLCGHAQRVALTFDDGLNPREHSEAAAWNAAILRGLDAAGVKSILFAAGRQVAGAGMALVKNWGLAGHGIGNHTYSHMDLGSDGTGLAQYIADVERNESLLKEIPGWTRRFRFPYLKEGDTAAKRDGMRAWLAQHGYASGAVSIDASDWYYDQRYQAWLAMHPNSDPAPFRQAYLDHLWNRAAYYESLSKQLLGRSVDHVLLLHTRHINADFLPDIIAMFRAKGWTIIAPAQAYDDPLYSMKPATLPAGESILWALAKQAGLPGLRYPAEDDVYEKPILDRLGL